MASPTKTIIDTNIQLGQGAEGIAASHNDWAGSTITFVNFGLVGFAAATTGLHITGIAGDGVGGRLLAIVTRFGSGDPFTLDHNSGSSSAANRLQLGGSNVPIGKGAQRPGLLLMYENYNNFWYSLS
jgi:hypothetical protein